MRIGLLVALFATPAAALSDTLTQTLAFDYNPATGAAFPIVQGFDTQGGTRQLNSVTFEFRHNFALDLFVESTGPTAVEEGDYAFEFSFISLFQLGDGSEGSPFFGPGGIYLGGVSGALAAYDGVAGNDGADSYHVLHNESFSVVQTYTQAEPDVLGAVTDAGAIPSVYGGFTELFFNWVNPPSWPPPAGEFPEYPTDAAIWINWQNFRHFGEFDVIYDYTVVPEPATLMLLPALALAARRR